MMNDSALQEIEEDENSLPVLPADNVVANITTKQEIPDSEDPGSEEVSIGEIDIHRESVDGIKENYSCSTLSLDDTSGTRQRSFQCAEEPHKTTAETMKYDDSAVMDHHDELGLKLRDTEGLALGQTSDSRKIGKLPQSGPDRSKSDAEILGSPDSNPKHETTAFPQQVLECMSSAAETYEVERASVTTTQDTDITSHTPDPDPFNSHIEEIERCIPDSDDSDSMSDTSVHDNVENGITRPHKRGPLASLDVSRPSTDEGHSDEIRDQGKDALVDIVKDNDRQIDSDGRTLIEKVALEKEAGTDPKPSLNVRATRHPSIAREHDGIHPPESQESTKSLREDAVSSNATVTEKNGEVGKPDSPEKQIYSYTTATPQACSSSPPDEILAKANAIIDMTDAKDQAFIKVRELPSSIHSSERYESANPKDMSSIAVEVSSSSPQRKEQAIEQDEEVDLIDTPTSSPPILEPSSRRQVADEEEAQMNNIPSMSARVVANSVVPSQDETETKENIEENRLTSSEVSKDFKKEEEQDVEMRDILIQSSQPATEVFKKRNLASTVSTSPQTNEDVLFTELKSMKIAAIQARNAALKAEIDAKKAKLEEMKSQLKYPAAETVKNHIKLLHDYNDIRDVGQGLVGMIADNRGVRIGQLYDEFGVGLQD